jgi:hypothetical protein
MKNHLTILSLSLCLILITSIHVCAADWTGNVNFTLGSKALDKDDWEPIEDQGEFGINVDFRKKEWPVNIAIAILGSAGEGKMNGINVKGTTSELRFGVRKIWEPNEIMRPFLGGGVALLSAEYEGSSSGVRVSDDDTGIGLWLNGGIYWTLSHSFNLGFELGYSTGEVTLYGVDGNAGGGHAALLLGYHW